LIVFLDILNGFKVWGADFWNVYLEAMTKDEIYLLLVVQDVVLLKEI
jgi:hypothetical protein